MSVGDLLGDASGVDEDINLAEAIMDVLDGLSDLIVPADIHGIVDGLDTGLLLNLLGSLLADVWLAIENGDATDTSFNKALGHVVAKTTSAAVVSIREVTSLEVNLRSLPSDNRDLATNGVLFHGWSELSDDVWPETHSDTLDVFNVRLDWAVLEDWEANLLLSAMTFVEAHSRNWVELLHGRADESNLTSAWSAKGLTDDLQNHLARGNDGEEVASNQRHPERAVTVTR